MKNEILWDRLSGEVDIFVKNYLLSKQKSYIKPTYKVADDLPIEKLLNAKSWEDNRRLRKYQQFAEPYKTSSNSVFAEIL